MQSQIFTITDKDIVQTLNRAIQRGSMRNKLLAKRTGWRNKENETILYQRMPLYDLNRKSIVPHIF
ncbi:hypothetical protein [Candidatus Methylacidiphilum fumarolicum]|nr:hypothetical protein [Candidatus Methylacidiphilum fumarolicum]